MKKMAIMRVMQRRDFVDKVYKKYLVPGQRKVSIHEKDMDTEINCASCGLLLPAGETYTSKTIHNDAGLGYSICNLCYNQEIDEVKENNI